MKYDVVVIGSANMDTVYSVAHIPAPGETVTASAVIANPGGKGANQAVAASRSGAKTAFLGAVGRDAAGEALKASLAKAGVATEGVRESDVPTGSAFISVSDVGENSIVVHPGANATVDKALIDANEELLASATVCVMQLEVPNETVWHAMRVCAAHKTPVLLNPSPLAVVPDEMLPYADILVPNELEAEVLTGSNNEDALMRWCGERKVRRVIMTMGDKGVWDITPVSKVFYPCKKVKAADTTGAGDCFLGSLAACLASGSTVEDAIRFAMAASAIEVTRMGAQQAMPSREEILEKLAED